MHPNHQYDKGIWGIAQVFSKGSKNLYPVFFRYAKLIYIRFSFLWHTTSSVDWFYCRQNSKTNPSPLQDVSQLLNPPTYHFLLLSKSKGSLLAFFFNTEVTVSLLMDNTLPISRTPLLLTHFAVIRS